MKALCNLRLRYSLVLKCCLKFGILDKELFFRNDANVIALPCNSSFDSESTFSKMILFNCLFTRKIATDCYESVYKGCKK